jgi:hypothetical protein
MIPIWTRSYIYWNIFEKERINLRMKDVKADQKFNSLGVCVCVCVCVCLCIEYITALCVTEQSIWLSISNQF